MPAVGDAEGGGGEVAVVLEVEEVVADLRLGEAVGRGVEVVGEHADGAEVGVLGAVGEAGELEVLGHAATECGGHVRVLSQEVKEIPCQDVAHRRGECQESVGSVGMRDDRRRPSRYTGCGRSACRASGLLEHGVAADPLRRAAELWR